ncbi:MAG: isochorismate synthase [Thermostichus sp. HHBFW_bins_43]
MTSSLSPCSEWPRAWPTLPIHTSAWIGEEGGLRRWDPLLEACQQMARARGVPQILSVSRPFPGLDPLVVLAHTLHSLRVNEPVRPEDPGYCYLSHRARSGAVRVLGLGSLRRVYLLGEGRFQAARAFLEELQPHLHAEEASWGCLSQPIRQERPLCFSRFSFNPVRTCGPAAMLVLPQWQLLQAQAGGPDSRQDKLGQDKLGWQGLLGRQGSPTVARLNLEVCPESDLASLASQIADFFAQMERFSQETLPPWELQAPLQVDVDGQVLLARIQKALQAIRAGSLEKVVLAEAVDLPLPSPPPIPSLLAYLEKRYPDCSVFAFAEGVGSRESLSSGDGQDDLVRACPPGSSGSAYSNLSQRVFLGASPERLLSVWQGQVQIDALAGSAARGETDSQDQALAQQLLHSTKDRREHQLVVRSVREALGQVGLDPFIPPRPRLLRLANIQHLQTLIEADMPSNLHLFDLLEQLHPTAAVGGYPKQAAVRWLETVEPFDRSGYAAPLGWVDLQGNGEFVVAIRSALIRGDRARLYAGAGIVADSHPEQEVAEIRLKLQSLAQALAMRSIPAVPTAP